ncbi:DUF4296 domain-containing protein [Tamlana sp. 2201CG12-4]|uniref:DUF4296 domain-containing protein n=1 Tax=Tamlana sp. 2201CG12-4 TaxID=3112582 RepID=UPI002DB8F2F6|nr:DUF4296 domain-containing protein [Tamlana sp. 2201CG12-4]MEC3906623.1 DUF4296 domain-containing protein [Tamlana sp. 2201CG12-4]
MIVKRFILVLVIAIIASACNRFNGPKKPENLISKDKMVDIIIDSKLLTVANTKNKRIMIDSNIVMSSYLFKKHNIDSLQFATSNSYYAYHIEDYEDIYIQALDSLERLNVVLKEKEAQEWKEQTKREEDSLNAVLVEKQIDSLILPFKDVDSLQLLVKRDSIRDVLLTQKKLEEKDILEEKDTLINPVSDIDVQP